MSTGVVYSAIKSFLDANWSDTPLVYENTNEPIADDPSDFIYVEISGNSYGRASIGSPDNNLWRENGLLWFHIMIPSGEGSLGARTYAESLIELLRDQQLLSGKLTFQEASVGLGEPGDENGNYWRLSMSVDWVLDT